jgi:aminoglycoside phosphotransferase (APT) family kinase protein
VAGLSTLPVPEPVFADATEGVIAYSRLPGHPLIERPVAEPARLAPALGEFMGGLHLAPLEKMEKLMERDSYPLSAWLEDAERDYGQIAEHTPAASRLVIEEFLGHAPPAGRSVEAFCHNDLGAEHVLVNAEANDVTGIIDWTDAAIADPVRDLALVFRDLGPGAYELTLAHYGCSLEDTDRERAVFYARCKLLEDIAYGVSNSGAPHYAEAGLARLDRTFADFA